jgi:hypothetical protein
MIRSLTYLLIPGALALGSGGLAAQGAFEGVVHVRLSGQGGQAMEPVYYIKGGKTRVEMNANDQTVVMLMDVGSGAMTTLMPAQKMYLTMNMGTAAEQRLRGDARTDADLRFAATGQKETIAGIPCEHYSATRPKDGGQIDLCLARGMGTFLGVSIPAGNGPMGSLGKMGGMGSLPPGAEQFAKTFKDGAFLLKMEAKQAGRTEMTMVVTQLERKPLDASLFTPPRDYREMRMPG